MYPYTNWQGQVNFIYLGYMGSLSSCVDWINFEEKNILKINVGHQVFSA